jgi:hypothetical protein
MLQRTDGKLSAWQDFARACRKVTGNPPNATLSGFLLRLNHPSLGRRYLLDFSNSLYATPLVRTTARWAFPSPAVFANTPSVVLDTVRSMMGIGTSIPSGCGTMITLTGSSLAFLRTASPRKNLKEFMLTYHLFLLSEPPMA